MNRSIQIKHEIISRSYKSTGIIIDKINTLIFDVLLGKLVKSGNYEAKDDLLKKKELLSKALSDILTNLIKYSALPFNFPGRTSNFELTLQHVFTIKNPKSEHTTLKDIYFTMEFVFLDSFPICLYPSQIEDFEKRVPEVLSELDSYFIEIQAMYMGIYSKILYEATQIDNKINTQIGYEINGTPEFIKNLSGNIQYVSQNNDRNNSEDINELSFNMKPIKNDLFLEFVCNNLKAKWDTITKQPENKTKKEILYVRSFVSHYPKFTINCLITEAKYLE